MPTSLIFIRGIGLRYSGCEMGEEENIWVRDGVFDRLVQVGDELSSSGRRIDIIRYSEGNLTFSLIIGCLFFIIIIFSLP